MTAIPGSAPSRPAITLLVALLCAVWGSTWLVIRTGLEDLPPFTSAAARFAIAALCMRLVARWLAEREGGGEPPAALVLVMGVFNFALSFACVYWAEQFLPSALASILWAVFPIFLAIAAHFVLPAERLTGLHALGFAAGFAGVVLLFAEDVRGIGPAGVKAALVLLISPFVVSIGTVLIKRHGAGVSSLKLNRDALLVAALLLAGLALFAERDRPVRITGAAVFSVVYLALMGTVLTFGIFYWLLRHAPAYKLAVIPYVTPVIAVLLGVTLADEPVRWSTFAGMGLIFGGVLAVTRTRVTKTRQ